MTLTARLEKIESSGLIRLAQADPDLEYMFRHALVQDATYESLLKADRRSLHSAVGETLENLYAGRLDEIAATLALHFEKAEEHEKAVRYLIRAGEAAARTYAINEAIELFGHVLDIIPASFPGSDLINFYSQYGRVLELAGRFDASVEVYDRMRAEGLSRKNPQMELDALMSRAILHSTPSPLHNFGSATELSKQALSIAQTLGNREAQSRTYWILMLAMLFEGRLQESVSYGEQSLEIARTLDNPEQLAFTLNDIARCYYGVKGSVAKGRAANLEARALWQKLGNLPMLGDNLATGGEYLFFNGDFDKAVSMSLEGYEIGKSIHNIWGQTFCLMNLGFCYMEMGEIDKCLQANLELISFDRRQTFPIAHISSYGQLAEIYRELGDLETGYGYILSAFEQSRVLEPSLQAPAFAGLAQYELLRGNPDEAEKLFKKSLLHGYDRENFTTFVPQYVEAARNDLLMHKGEFSAALEALDPMFEIMDHLEIVFCQPGFMLRKANALLGLERRAEALTVLESAASLAERIGSRRILWKIYALMGKLQAESAQPAKAHESRQAALQEIDFLAGHCPANLHETFLQLPEVREILETDESNP
jgi:tetratricopeptide (TPR) repeat protein